MTRLLIATIVLILALLWVAESKASEPVMFGDINCSGTIDQTDAKLLRHILLYFGPGQVHGDPQPCVRQKRFLNINCDRALDGHDFVSLVHYLAGKDPLYMNDWRPCYRIGDPYP